MNVAHSTQRAPLNAVSHMHNPHRSFSHRRLPRRAYSLTTHPTKTRLPRSFSVSLNGSSAAQLSISLPRSRSPCLKQKCNAGGIIRKLTSNIISPDHLTPSSANCLPSSCTVPTNPLIVSNANIVVIAAGMARIMLVPIPL